MPTHSLQLLKEGNFRFLNNLKKNRDHLEVLNQLKDNIKSIHHKIMPQTIEHINTIKIKNLDLLNPSLWK